MTPAIRTQHIRLFLQQLYIFSQSHPEILEDIEYFFINLPTTTKVTPFHHKNKVPKDVKNIIGYAEKYIFGMPVRLITTEAWNKDIKLQKMLPRDSMLFIDLADYDPKK